MPRNSPPAKRKNRSAYVENRLREICEAKKDKRFFAAREKARLGEKRCSLCAVTKPANDFYDDAISLDGLRSECKQCNTDVRKAVDEPWAGVCARCGDYKSLTREFTPRLCPKCGLEVKFEAALEHATSQGTPNDDPQ